jgi:drug/metabolite transporter (DMT)-like permease
MMSLIALTMDHASLRLPTAIEWAAITYNAVIVFGFAHVAWFRLARILPPVASSLSVMFIPVLGVFAGMAMLGEVPHWQDYTAILLILAAMSTVLFKSKAS